MFLDKIPKTLHSTDKKIGQLQLESQQKNATKKFKKLVSEKKQAVIPNFPSVCAQWTIVSQNPTAETLDVDATVVKFIQ